MSLKVSLTARELAALIIDMGRILPGCATSCDPDCEAGVAHCEFIHLPNHKIGWHSKAECPFEQMFDPRTARGAE